MGRGQQGKAEAQLSVWPPTSSPHAESIFSSPPKIVLPQYFPTKIETRASKMVCNSHKSLVGIYCKEFSFRKKKWSDCQRPAKTKVLEIMVLFLV